MVIQHAHEELAHVVVVVVVDAELRHWDVELVVVADLVHEGQVELREDVVEQIAVVLVEDISVVVAAIVRR